MQNKTPSVLVSLNPSLQSYPLQSKSLLAHVTDKDSRQLSRSPSHARAQTTELFSCPLVAWLARDLLSTTPKALPCRLIHYGERGNAASPLPRACSLASQDADGNVGKPEEHKEGSREVLEIAVPAEFVPHR